MNITQYSLRNPAGIGVAVAIVVFFGLFSLSQLPIQLFPNIDEPQISVQTGWRAASPKEIESEILEPQEEVLRGIPGLQEMNANAGPGGAWIGLEFGLETDMQQALLEVISRLNRIPPLPRDATPPQVFLGEGGGGGGANESLTWFFIQLLPGTPGPIEDYRREVEDVLKPKIEAIAGVSNVQIHAGAEEELQVVFDPYRAAELGIDITSIARLAGTANDVSGGFVDVGRRQYTLRFAGRYSPEELADLILEWREGSPVRLGDIADIQIRRGDQTNFTIQNGNPAIAMQVGRESGANVLEALNAVKAAVEEVRVDRLEPMGLTIAQSFDASVFIYRAIGLVTNNLGLGILLAVGVLWWFLRQARATAIVALAIPMSLLTTFVMLNLFGRTLNVISLAGLAFATGMVLDAAIVVLENIVRLREKGHSAADAAAKGTAQVWGALVASTATTIAIFLPVIFLKDVEGQLFADLALTIAIAVFVSLIVAVTVLPTAATRFLRDVKITDRHANWWAWIDKRIITLTDSPKRRWSLIGGLMSVPILLTALLMPQLDYLPPVKRDAIDAFFNFPPGASGDMVRTEMVDIMVERLQPYMDGEKEPALKNYYFWIWGNGGTLGARVKDQTQIKELERIVREEISAGLPDTQTFASQGNLFGGFGGGRNISMILQSRDVQALMDTARAGVDLIPQKIEGVFPRPWPGTELAEPELRLIPDDRRINEAGWNRGTVSTVVRALGDGVWIGEHFDGERRLDMILRAEGWSTPEELESIPLSTPAGTIVPLGELMDIERTVGPSSISRYEGRRTIFLQFEPPENMSLQEAIEILETQVEPELKAMLPPDGSIQYGGSASSLKRAIRTMSQNFGLALVVLFMLMAALFKSLKDSFLVILALPLATVGGVVSLRLLNLFTFQPLDLLTMIGFVILLGLVVNNAILLVHQTRSAEREGASRRESVAQALRLRTRPILMSTLTSLFGMLPLLLMPGVGSVIYRGLASVIVGGMSVSAIFTLLLLPALLRLGEPAVETESIRDGAAAQQPA